MRKQVEIFPWNDNFSTGIEKIDVQHKRLVELLNLLVSHLAYQSDAPALGKIVEELKAYTVEHFTTEEHIWSQYFHDDAWARSHEETHASFVAKVVEVTAHQTDRPYEVIIEEIVVFLTHWLALHIIESDKRMAKVVLAVSTGLTLEDAKELANKEMTGATRVLIDTVMGMYDSLATRTIQMTREINRRTKAEAGLLAAQAELLRLKNEAIEANRAKSAFLANMSHEIRTPLNAISGLAHLLRRSGLSEEQSGRLDQLDAANAHLMGVINDILDFSKIEAGHMLLEEASFHVEATIGNIVSMVHDRATGKGLRIIRQSEYIPYPLLGDPLRLQQILLNFVSNAIKFTEQGSVTLRVKLEQDEAEAVVMRFEVEDTGIGIPPEAMGRLFSAFEQAEKSTTRKFGGTGLGLAINKRLIELMGGNIGVTSTPSVGSTFWFTVRLKKGSTATVTRIDPGAGETSEVRLRQSQSGRHILLAEDEPVNREVVLMMLEDVGLIVDTAENGEEAVQKMSANRYDLVLMDMQMPVMDGLTATREIRRLPNGGQVPIIALTANAFAEDRAACLDAGMNDFTTKPINPDQLYLALERWLKQVPSTH